MTFPSRAYSAGTERRFFAYLRSDAGNADEVKRLKGWILEQYEERGAA